MKHKIGDVVTIRSWESMAAEFGTHVINCRDVINVPAFLYLKCAWRAAKVAS